MSAQPEQRFRSLEKHSAELHLLAEMVASRALGLQREIAAMRALDAATVNPSRSIEAPSLATLLRSRGRD